MINGSDSAAPGNLALHHTLARCAAVGIVDTIPTAANRKYA
jgi:hypothetical protein